jgi:hypothetical protein
MAGRVDSGLGPLITSINGTGNRVIHIEAATGQTAQGRIAGLRPITELVVITQGVVGHMLKAVRRLIAEIVCTVDTVVLGGSDTGVAANGGVTGLGTVTIITVITLRVVRRVDDLIIGLVTGVGRTGDIVVSHDRWALHTPGAQVADLRTVTEERVVALGVISLMRDHVRNLVTSIHRTRNVIA